MHGVDINLSFNLEKIYENCNFVINNDDKVGITGVNGAGKTTLFKVILNRQSLDSGKIEIGNKTIGYLPQEIVLEDKNISVFEYLLSARPIEKLEKELTDLYTLVAEETNIKEQNKILKQISKTQDNLDYYEPYTAANILFNLISNFNIDNLLDMKLKDLSGGQKSKIAFLHLLYSKSEILLLDEPTNHLDSETRNFITEYLKQYKGMILIISHDIPFLDSITNKTLYIDKANKGITVYDGNYTTFLKKYEKQKELRNRIIDKQEKENQKLREITLLYSNSSGKRKRMAQSREKLLEKKLSNTLKREEVNKVVSFKIKPVKESGKIPLKVNNIVFGYNENKTIIQNISFNINNKERFLIVGNNGVGKSTLLKLIVGTLKPSQGSIWFDAKTDIAYYAQEQENLDLEKSVFDNMDEGLYSEKDIRAMLGNFLFTGDDSYKKVGFLSPGERARLCLCKVMIKRPNFLLLDEPTNHLDPKTQEIIGQNFRNYEGTIILVSHNPSFVNSIGIDRMLVLPEGRICNYSSELLNYYYEENKKL